jgi:PadR family transcriptional regulator PadR
MPQRITNQLLAVLIAFLAEPEGEWYGLELMERAGLSSGTLYPILHRLLDDGWLVRTRDVPSEIGGGGRRLYKLTGVGAAAAADVLESRKALERAGAPRIRPGVQPA